MIENVYIHIPFCKLKCNYCSFISFERMDLIEKYINVLKNEIKSNYKGEILKTLYFGGGTPSLCSKEQLADIITMFNFNENTEITIEANPNDVNENYLKELLNIGINRISFGVQTFNDEILKIIGRRHTSKEGTAAILAAKKAGFKNISADLIYGLPNQSATLFKTDLEKVLKLDIQHISFYGLKIEEGCKFNNSMPNDLPDLDMQADMYEMGCETLKSAGFEHYEISNFAIPGFHSRHNINYWNNSTYYGFGLGAHGFDGVNRYANHIILDKYFKNPFEKYEIIKISIQDRLEESIFLGLRKQEGINIENINKNFNIDFEKKYNQILKKYAEFFNKTINGYAFNNKGFLISNEILSEFIE